VRTRSAIALLLCCAAATLAFAQKDPASLPARDLHEGLLVAANPLQDAAQYKPRLGKKNPYEAGIVAIELFFRNDNDKAIRVDLETIQLIIAAPGAERQRLQPLAIGDVVDRILNKGGPNPTQPRRRIPIPGRGPKTGRSKEWIELEAALRSASLGTDILAPHSSARGFLFFDLNHHFDLLAYSRLYLPDLKFLDSQPLLFFEVDLAKASPH
jgi:hypothetical protein